MAVCLVTGAAGFIGSHLCERLLAEGHRVIGVDAFIPYYPREYKERNLVGLLQNNEFRFHELDLREANLDELLKGVDVVVHLAAMAGLVRSWSEFDLYTSCNLTATQRLLEAARNHKPRHFIYGSTSSAYGKYATGDEQTPTHPISPYGITKLASEYLCQAYAEREDLPLTILRFFSVYGPRQRPDMGYHIFIRAMLRNEIIPLFGDGTQSRSNTYIADCVDGIYRAIAMPERSINEIFNLGGGEVVDVNQVLGIIAEELGVMPRLDLRPERPGEQLKTSAEIAKIQRMLHYNPRTSVRDGLHAQIEWERALYEDMNT